ncbi:MAG TPA: Fe-S cluster assembly protein SufD [Ktedonobacterales bacterium]|jgi:Fe-S cluster assembly protein SufD
MTAPVARRGFTEEAIQELIARRAEPEWMRERRLEAWRAYQAIPMPARTDEEWRRTDLSRLRLDEIEPFAEGSDGQATLVPPAERDERFAGFLGFRDARRVEYSFDKELAAAGVIFTDLATAVREHPDLVREYFMTRCVPPEDSKFAALHGAFWDNGVFLYVPRGVALEHPLRAVISAGLKGTSSLSHTLIMLDEGSRAVYAEDYISPDEKEQGVSSRIVEIILKRDANLHYVGTQRWGHSVYDFHTERALLGQDTVLNLQTIELGSRLAKGRVESMLEGDGANVKLLGLYIEDGNQHLDRYTLQDHKGQAGVSDLLFKGVLTDKARSVFSGLIRVHPTGKKTAAYQQNRNLLLSRTARADSIPNLEIAASDILGCTHGATVGKVDEEQLFYLMCRGLTRVEATRLIVEGFVDPIIEQVPIATLRDSLRQEVQERVEGVEVS